LAELFARNHSSQVTQYFPIGGGVGRGSVRISLLFRPVLGLTKTKSRLGFDIGTVRIQAPPRIHDFTDGRAADLHLASLRLRTLAGAVRISGSRHSHLDEANDSVTWHVDAKRLPLKIPARRRYAAPLVVVRVAGLAEHFSAQSRLTL
jgi:hypothetical protein